MRLGVGLFTGQRPSGSSRTHADLYADLLDHARLAEKVGLDSFWVSEHHFAEDGYLPAVLPVAAALAAVTSRITIGSGVLIASFYHPVRLAEDLIALDLLSQGRFVAGIGFAYRPEEFRGMQVSQDGDLARTEEIIEILRQAFTGRPFRHAGRHFQLPELEVTPHPHTPGGPPLMIAGNGVTDRDAVRAGRMGAMYMVDPALPFDEVTRLVGIYDGALASGAQPDLPLFCYGFVTRDGSAWARVEAGFTYLRDTYDRWQHKPPSGRRDPRDYRLLLGTPAELLEQVLAYRDRFGDRLHLVLRLSYPGMDPAAVGEAITVYGEVAERARAS